MIPRTTTAYIQGQARQAIARHSDRRIQGQARQAMARHGDRRYLVVVVDYVGPTWFKRMSRHWSKRAS